MRRRADVPPAMTYKPSASLYARPGLSSPEIHPEGVTDVYVTPSGDVSMWPLPPAATRPEVDPANPLPTIDRSVGAERCVQLIPSVEVACFATPPDDPVAWKIPRFAFQVTFSIDDVENDEVRCVHVTPSGEVASLPDSPTATNKPSAADHATPRIDVVPNDDVRPVHVAPSGEVRNVPESPTATNRLFAGDHATAKIVVAPNPDVCVVQVTPSGEVASVPESPTMTSSGNVGDQHP